MTGNPTGRPKSNDRNTIELLQKTMSDINIRDAARDGKLAIPLERVRNILREIRRTERKKIKKRAEHNRKRESAVKVG